MAEGLSRIKLPTGEQLVLHSKTENACKICSSPFRVEIEKLLIARSDRGKDEFGVPITKEYIQKWAQENGLYLSDENIINHFAKHLRYAEAKKQLAKKLGRIADKEMRAAAVAKVAQDLNVVDILDKILSYGTRNLEETDGTTVGIAEVLKTIELKMKLEAAPAVNELNAAAAAALRVNTEKKIRDLEQPTEVEAVEVEVIDEE